MTVRARAFWILALTVGGLAVLSYAFARTIVLRGFQEVEEQDALAHLDRVVGALQADAENLRDVVLDWAWWDDTCAFVEGRAPGFLEANVVPAVFRHSRLQAILFLDLEGRVVDGRGYDRSRDELAGVPAGLSPLLGPLARQALAAPGFRGVSGVLTLPGGRSLVAGVPIVTSDGEGPPLGVVLMTRPLDQAEVELLRERVRLSFVLGEPRPEASGGPALRAPSPDEIAGYVEIADVFGAPALGVELRLPRAIHRKGVWTAEVLMAVLAAGGALLVSVAWLLLDRALLAPIARLGAELRAIRASGDGAGRVAERGRDEVRSLAKDVNRTLDALEASERDRREKERLGQAAALLDGLPAYAYLKDAAGRYVLANRRFSEALGCSPEAVAGSADRDLLPEPFAGRLERRDRAVLEGGEAVLAAEEPFRDRDREVVVSARAVPLRDAAGRVTGVAGLLFDVTELARARERLSLLAAAVEQAGDNVVVTDPHGIIQYVNPSFEATTGYAAAEAVGRDVRMLQNGRHDPAHYASVWEALARGRTWSGRFVNRRKDGSSYEAECTISPVRDEAGQIVRYASVQRDVTRLASLERQLRHAQKLEAVGTLAGGIAHDFNNALTPILLAAEMVRREVEPGTRADRLLRQVVAASERARDLVAQILAFSRQGEQERRVVHVVPILKETLKLMRSTLPSSLAIRERLETEEDRVLADPVQLHQVLVNLLTNAGQAVGTAPGEIGVEVSRIGPGALPEAAPFPDREHLCIAVRDTGCGLDDEARERAFEPFFTTRPPGEGVGLGLAVVHGIVQGSGGAVTVESAPGKGATFRVFLPLEPAPCAEAGAGAWAPARGREGVLLVDDDAGSLEALGELLSSLGYRVSRARRPTEALAVFRAAPEGCDVVVADQTMPEMSGLELIRRLRELRPGLPAILVTGRGAAPSEAPSGADVVLAKPVAGAALAGALRRVLGGGAGAPARPLSP